MKHRVQDKMAEKSEPDFIPNKKQEAAQMLYDLMKPQKFWSLSFLDLQAIILARPSEEFVDLITKLVFHDSNETLSESELVKAIDKFTKDLDVAWPLSTTGHDQLANHSRKRRMSYAKDIATTAKRSRETSRVTLESHIQGFAKSSSTNDYKISDFIRQFAAQLLKCVYTYMIRDGYEKEQIMANLKWLIKRYKEESRWWIAVQKRCVKCIGGKKRMSLLEFQKVFSLEKFMAERIFALADTNNDGEVDRKELFAVTSILVTGDTSEKLKFLFAIYDQNGDGTLHKTELTHALASCIKDNKLDVTENNAGRLTDLLFKKAKQAQGEDGVDGALQAVDVVSVSSGGQQTDADTMSYEELDSLLRQNPVLYYNLNINLTNQQKMNTKPAKRLKFSQRVQRIKQHAMIYTSLWVWIFLMSSATIAIGAERLYQQINQMGDIYDIPLVIAKTCGQMLNFLLALVLVFNLKHVITKLNQTWIRPYLPLDDAIYLHKLTAAAAFVIAVIHVLAHLTLITLRMLHPDKVYEVVGAIAILVIASGAFLVLLLVAILITTSPKLRNKSYSVFYITHRLFTLLWYIALFCHAKHFIYWVLAPGTLFILERIHFIYTIFKNRSVVVTASTNDNVTVLTIKRPDHFRNNPGDYVMVRIPAVSEYLWRPFTISSSKHDEITLHIRKVGLWTGKLHDMVQQRERATQLNGEVDMAFNNYFAVEMEATNLNGNDQEVKLDQLDTVKLDQSDTVKLDQPDAPATMQPLPSAPAAETQPKKVQRPVTVEWKIFMNGPFSTPSHDILKTEHAILVAGGIGITPFASVLESVVNQLKQSSKVCPCGCEHRVYFDNDAGFGLKRIDLFWLTRTQKSLGWFIKMFKELEEEQLMLGLDPPIVNVHLYLTGLLKETDMRGTFLQLALNTAYDEGSADLLTGLRAQTKPGRPEWGHILPQVLEEMKSERAGPEPSENVSTAKLYACGPAQLCKDLKRHCSQLKIPFREEVFN